MTKEEFRQKISELLNITLDDGPGPHAVALMTGDALAQFIMNEAGATAPGAMDEVCERMQGAIKAVEERDRGGESRADALRRTAAWHARMIPMNSSVEEADEVMIEGICRTDEERVIFRAATQAAREQMTDDEKLAWQAAVEAEREKRQSRPLN
jgi:hypothetical protein